MKIVIVGGTGDLSRRMLLPALYFLDADGLLAPDVEVIGLSRMKLDRDGFRDMALTALKERAGEHFDAAVWARFSDREGADRQSGGDLLPVRLAQPVRRHLRFSEGRRPDRGPEPDRAGKAHRPGRSDQRGDQRGRGQCLCRGPDLSDRPLSGQGDGPEPDRAALRQCPVRAPVERTVHRPRPDHRGRDRGGGGSLALL